MTLKATCPNNPKHNRFHTTAHVVQTWEVNEHGDFQSELSTDETTHGPNVDNIWTCAVCNAEAKVEEKN